MNDLRANGMRTIIAVMLVCAKMALGQENVVTKEDAEEIVRVLNVALVDNTWRISCFGYGDMPMKWPLVKEAIARGSEITTLRDKWRKRLDELE